MTIDKIDHYFEVECDCTIRLAHEFSYMKERRTFAWLDFGRLEIDVCFAKAQVGKELAIILRSGEEEVFLPKCLLSSVSLRPERSYLVILGKPVFRTVADKPVISTMPQNRRSPPEEG